MVSHRIASRIPLLALVVAAHLTALVLLIILTRTQLIRRVEEAPLLLIWLAPTGPTSQGRPLPRRRDRTPGAGVSIAPSVATPPPSATATAPTANAPATDWAAEGHAAAARQVEQEELARREAAAFGPRHNDAFAARKRPPEFHWGHARTHRIEPLEGGLGVAVNLNDHCALILFALIPMVGCTIGDIPVRGDLFDHMHDPPEPGAWKEH